MRWTNILEELFWWWHKHISLHGRCVTWASITSLLMLFIVSTVNALEFMIDSTSVINFKEAPRFFSRVASMKHLDQVDVPIWHLCNWLREGFSSQLSSQSPNFGEKSNLFLNSFLRNPFKVRPVHPQNLCYYHIYFGVQTPLSVNKYS